TQIKGIGKVLAGKLGEVGIGSVDDLARLEENEITAIKDKLDARGPIDLIAWRDKAREIVAH
ncbi:MAG: helix-hairpin-helix domain-containing protein, partial [Pseudomonadota bacterium]